MKIVNLTAFRALPPYTLFKQGTVGEHSAIPAFGDLEIKFDTWETDFITMPLDWPERISEDNHPLGAWAAMFEHRISLPLDIDIAGRDGLFDKDKFFLVYEKGDLEKLRVLIDGAIKAAAT